MARRIVGAAALAVLAVFLEASSVADGRDFHVGGRGGWAPNPSEPFNAWAERNRFQVNDTLVFSYNKDADAVLVVTPSHYDACNTTDPVLRLAGGDSRFAFNASGPFFFISADAARCRAGERLIVVVLAVRNNNTPSPSLSPPPPPPPKSPSSTTTPATRAPPRSPPKSSPSPPTSPPPAAAPAPHALPPPPPASKNASSPSLAPEPAASTKNGTSSPPPPSSAVGLMRGGVLAWLLIGGAAMLI